MTTLIVVFVLLTAGCCAQTYQNNAQGFLFHICPSNEAVSGIKSTHVDSDRLWNIGCKPFVGVASACSWSGPINLFEKELNYNCPANSVITGVYSNYNHNHEDRSWYFQCCTTDQLITFECRESPKVNYFNEDFNWRVPGDNFLTGVQTHSKNNDGDHRWSFNYCRAIIQDGQTINSQILTANSPIENHLTEGDVFVSATRSANICTDCRWPKSSGLVQVPYTLSDSFSSSDKVTIEKAIEEFHLSTCVRFVPRILQTSYVSIVKGEGCFSEVGRTGSPQTLSLGAGCINNGIIQHELLHALGFWHEQNRSDRDIYVEIHSDNIEDGRQLNFNKRETDNLNVPYEYSSVMHYGSRDFSKNGRETITPIISTAAIGQRVGMTENDILKVNKLYSCQAYLHKNGEWDNQLEDVLSRQCASGQTVSGITSFHNNDKNDRLWGISCKAFVETRTCQWSNFVNNYWGSVDFKCADNKVIAGVYSDHSTILTDRKWKFYCCSATNFSTFNCKDTPVINYYDEYFSWKVASSNYLTGVRSTFDSHTKDRRWSFSYCQGTTQ
ncbi:tolloid-like protein 2 [Scophthalmus maximus]|uniref:tolloid-like protein 2 n=1 Tax=Scophthalmus maximus TaxID=52904 RepID=UPI001FA8F687|nr:tolloid-like protein 2 [Scophthalmus maximus]